MAVVKNVPGAIFCAAQSLIRANSALTTVLFLLTVLIITPAFAQSTIFEEDFESSLSWTKDGYAFWYTGTPKNGTHSVLLKQTGSITQTIPLTGYSDISVSFSMGAKSLDRKTENVRALYHNGASWVVLAQIDDGSANENGRLNPYTLRLPSSVNNLSTFALRFKINGSGTQDYAYVDDVSVTGTPIGPPPPAQTVYGFHNCMGVGQATVDSYDKIHAKAWRGIFWWEAMEPSDNQYYWAEFDAQYKRVMGAGMTLSWFIWESPAWANGGRGGLYVPPYPSSAFTFWSNKMAEFMAVAAARYPNVLWEIWSEQNYAGAWSGQANREAYSVLYRKVRSAMLAANPAAKISIGGVTNLGLGSFDGNIGGKQFIREMIEAGDPIDYVAIHPYGPWQEEWYDPAGCKPWESNFRNAWDIRALLNSLGHSATPLWLTEWGDFRDTDEQRQANYLTKAHNMIQNNVNRGCGDGAPQVALNATYSSWFCDFDHPSFPRAGVLRNNNVNDPNQVKPAGTAFKNFAIGVGQ